MLLEYYHDIISSLIKFLIYKFQEQAGDNSFHVVIKKDVTKVGHVSTSAV